MTEHRAQLHQLQLAHQHVAATRSWDEVVDESTATTALAASLAARHRRSDGTIDTAALAVDAADLYQHDELREQVIAALRHGGARRYAVLDDQAIVERVLAMSPEQLGGLNSLVQGAAMELQVEQLSLAGDLELPDGATFRLNGDFGTPGYDGVLEFEDGSEALVQIKASSGSGLIEDHLEAHPDITSVFTNREAAEAAEAAGLTEVAEITGIDVSLDDLTPGVDGLADELTTSLGEGLGELADELPLLALGIVAAQAAWAVHRGGDLDTELERVKRRSRSIGLWSAVGYGVGAVTGSSGLRVLATVGGKGTIAAMGAIEQSAGRVATHGLQQLRNDRHLLATIQTLEASHR